MWKNVSRNFDQLQELKSKHFKIVENISKLLILNIPPTQVTGIVNLQRKQMNGENVFANPNFLTRKNYHLWMENN